ncbi:TetR/AcrR family transcriptional regulator [Streptomyces sp. SID10853]|uniref:TetR/AcrR family transcriptional regulator n=1 Tax=Streptomyces sp. SID10853 TaxID=2706028 RepID=UPI0013C07D42|nr:TetR/AcrR family transcriptional regulator [Streptomyces sp. SID10853]NDZ77254.1 TetR/AcrR family transcriptional regulator [Streptomyces sp. SID10853]
MATDTTRARLLDEAERLFLERGYELVSMRAVNAAAGMNPAAVHYHFGSKEDLVVALLQSRLGPLWADRLAVLTRRRDAGWTPGAAELVDVVVRPLAELAARPEGRMLLHLLARTVLRDRDLPFDDPWFRHQPYRDLLAAARPDLPAQQVADRWRLAFDLLLQLYGEPAANVADLGAAQPPPVTTVIAFITAGLDAPSAGPEPHEG